MRLLAAFTALVFSFPNLSAAQQPSPPPTSSSSQATTQLAQSLAAMTGRVTLSDVALSGTARRITGSDDWWKFFAGLLFVVCAYFVLMLFASVVLARCLVAIIVLVGLALRLYRFLCSGQLSPGP